MTVKDLKNKIDDLSKALDIKEEVMTGIVELIQKGIIANPDKLFRECAPKLDITGYTDFTYLNMGEDKRYFFFDAPLPTDRDLDKLLKEVEKELSEGKEKKLELLEAQNFFLEELENITKKARGYASGSIKYSHSEEKGDSEICFMEVKRGVIVGKKTKKKTLADEVNNIGYELKAKNDQIMEFESIGSKNVEEEEPEESEKTETLDLATVKKEVQELLEEFKQLESNNAFKGLGLIHMINDLIEKLEEVPDDFKVLARKLEVQQDKMSPILSMQIDQKLEQSIKELEETSSISSTEELDDIFGTIRKMYTGWKQFLPEQEHSKGTIIEKIDDEIDILKKYEQQIIPLKEQYAALEDSPEKEQLANQINAYINEARIALA